MTDITWPPELYITFLFDQVFQRLPLHIKRNICNKSSVSLSRISIWLKAISSSFDTFLFPFFILAWSFTFTASKERQSHTLTTLALDQCHTTSGNRTCHILNTTARLAKFHPFILAQLDISQPKLVLTAPELHSGLQQRFPNSRQFMS